MPAASPARELEALQHRIAELDAEVTARDAFLAIAAHELRNPMTAIIGQVDFLLLAIGAGQCSPEQVEQRLERLQRLVGHYMKRTAILLDVSRITGGNLQLELEPFDLVTLLGEVADEFVDAAQHAGVSVTVTAPACMPGLWDRLAVEQVVDNLVSNAIKYGGGTPVGIHAWIQSGQVCIQVSDHGNGIPTANRQRIFERFERSVGRGERRSGFGVGLWVVRQLVGAIDGEIVVGDAPDGGALFTVTLPQHVGRKPQYAVPDT